MNSTRHLKLYTERARRWAAFTLVLASLVVCSVIAVMFGAVFANAWFAVGGAVCIAPLWAAMLKSGRKSAEWAELRYLENTYLHREHFEQAPPVPESLLKDLCGDDAAI